MGHKQMFRVRECSGKITEELQVRTKSGFYFRKVCWPQMNEIHRKKDRIQHPQKRPLQWPRFCRSRWALGGSRKINWEGRGAS